MIIVDAGVVADALLDDTERGRSLRERLLLEGDLAAPHLLDVEVVAVIRRLVASGVVSEERGLTAVIDLASLRIRRLPHLVGLGRMWALRDNVSAYDASYVAMAERFGCPLLTTDARLSRAPGVQCAVEVL